MSAEDQGQVPAGDRSPEQIRSEIEETRVELGETVAAVAEKTDVKKQAQDKADEVKEQVQAKADEVKQQAGQKSQELQAKAKQNPLPFALGGAILALLLLRWLFSR